MICGKDTAITLFFWFLVPLLRWLVPVSLLIARVSARHFVCFRACSRPKIRVHVISDTGVLYGESTTDYHVLYDLITDIRFVLFFVSCNVSAEWRKILYSVVLLPWIRWLMEGYKTIWWWSVIIIALGFQVRIIVPPRQVSLPCRTFRGTRGNSNEVS